MHPRTVTRTERQLAVALHACSLCGSPPGTFCISSGGAYYNAASDCHLDRLIALWRGAFFRRGREFEQNTEGFIRGRACGWEIGTKDAMDAVNAALRSMSVPDDEQMNAHQLAMAREDVADTSDAEDVRLRVVPFRAETRS